MADVVLTLFQLLNHPMLNLNLSHLTYPKQNLSGWALQVKVIMYQFEALQLLYIKPVRLLPYLP